MFDKALKSFIKDESGLETVEYVVMLGLIVPVIMLAIPPLVAVISGMYGKAADQF